MLILHLRTLPPLQDSLGARGISYVLSVSRCSPQPTFLPASRYLRIPIDDSLRDDLLPWIPAALRFIGTQMMMQYKTTHRYPPYTSTYLPPIPPQLHIYRVAYTTQLPFI